MTEDVRVSYGVKELLGRIDAKLEIIDGKLDSKADLREVIDLKDRVNGLERREEARIAIEGSRREAFSKREKIIGFALAAATLGIQILFARYIYG